MPCVSLCHAHDEADEAVTEEELVGRRDDREGRGHQSEQVEDKLEDPRALVVDGGVVEEDQVAVPRRRHHLRYEGR